MRLLCEVVPADESHIAAIAADVRDEDVAEFHALSRSTADAVMRKGLETSLEAHTALIDGVPVAMFGVSPYSLLAGQGIPWMVGTNGLRSLRAQKAILQVSAPMVDAWRDRFPSLLFNAVDDRNESAKRWLVWLGFRLLDPQPVGVDRLPFRPFYWSPDNV